jgi:uncharacterized protein (DUF2235 family)
MKHVIIIDGTGVSAADAENPFSNAYNLNWLLDNQANDDHLQIVLYSSGIGTEKSIVSYLSGATALGIDSQTREAYINLCSNFKDCDANGNPDKIYLFGFSRGAVVARALASLITKFGILKPNQMNHFPSVWKRFVKGDVLKENQLSMVLHKNVPIEMAGLFDCVFGTKNRTGQFHTLRFTDYHVPSAVKAAVHLVSLDDGRKAFMPMLWKPTEGTVLEQIWMPGVHSDVGGTYAKDRLGRIALITMMDRIAKYTDLKFLPDAEKMLPTAGRLTVNKDRFGIWRMSVPYRRRCLQPQSDYLHPIVEVLLDQEPEIRYKGRLVTYSVHPSFLSNGKPCPYFRDFSASHNWGSYAGM